MCFLGQRVIHLSQFLSYLISTENVSIFKIKDNSSRIIEELKSLEPFISLSCPRAVGDYLNLLDRVQKIFHESKQVISEEFVQRKSKSIQHECYICTNLFSSDKFIILNCSHELCNLCWSRVQDHTSCPFCRSEVSDIAHLPRAGPARP